EARSVERASMSEERFDAIVIGTGQAGPPLAVRLASLGRKTAILERKRFGGTCVNVGCIPPKQKILGAALLGIEADEAIHCIIDVMSAGVPYTAIRRAVHIHPTV